MKEGLAQMLKGGIIMDVVNAEQARIAEDAGACAVMALEKVPADIRRDGGVARMADPKVPRRVGGGGGMRSFHNQFSPYMVLLGDKLPMYKKN